MAGLSTLNLNAQNVYRFWFATVIETTYTLFSMCHDYFFFYFLCDYNLSSAITSAFFIEGIRHFQTALFS